MAGTSPFEHYDKDQQVRVPFEHYARLYRSLDPLEISRRCALSFDEAASAFSLRILGSEHRALFPDFALLDPAGRETDKPYEKILFIHYLCEGKFFPSQGRRLAYNEIPWGNVYYRNFEGRCLKRCAFAFGRDLPAFRRLVEGNAALRAEPLATGDAGYRIEFINGLYISLMLWAADDEFFPSAQILFDDNFVFAFTAEDLAAVGDVLIGRLKGMEERS